MVDFHSGRGNTMSRKAFSFMGEESVLAQVALEQLLRYLTAPSANHR